MKNIFNLNKHIVPKITNNARALHMNDRARLFTGTRCNYKCDFCYYKDQLTIKTDYNIILNRLIFLSRYVHEIELSGGESSIHKDWFKILAECNLRFKHISTLSNGSMFNSLEFTQKSKDYGLKEILFSIHGVGEIHDKIVGVKNAYKKIINAIDNAKQCGIIVRANCTVDDRFDGEEYAKLILDKKIKQINLLPINSWEDNISNINYSKISIEIKKFIDYVTIHSKWNDYDIRVRYIPLCFMNGYERYVYGIYQHIFDQYDWNVLLFDNDHKTSVDMSIDNHYDISFKRRLESYIKPSKCLKCKYSIICDGIEPNNLKNNKLIPIIDNNNNVITDISIFINKEQ